MAYPLFSDNRERVEFMFTLYYFASQNTTGKYVFQPIFCRRQIMMHVDVFSTLKYTLLN